MTDKSQELEVLKAEKATAQAQQDLAKTKLETLKAEFELAQFVRTSKQKAESEANTTLSKSQEEQAKAATGAANAQTEAVKAKFGSVTGTAFGWTSVENNAGVTEASLLLAREIDKTAENIAQELLNITEEVGAPVKDGNWSRKFVVFVGPQRPNLGEGYLFRAKLSAINAMYDRADAIAKPTVSADASNESDPATAITAAGATLDLIGKFGSYFLADYKFSSTNVNGVDSDLLAVSLVRQLPHKCVYPARWSPAGNHVHAAVLSELSALQERRLTTSKELVALSEKQAEIGAEMTAAEVTKGATAEKTKKDLTEKANRLATAVELYTAGNKLFDDMLASHSEVDNVGIPRLLRIAEQDAIIKILTDGGLAVIVQVAGVGGTTFTKKDFWMFLTGGAPFHVSGGAIASYVAIDAKGIVRAAGQKQIHTGYFTVQTVAETLDPMPRSAGYTPK